MSLESLINDKRELAIKLGQDLMDKYGPIVGGEDLRQVLGYKTAAAFRLALKLGDISLTIFNIEKRRGSCALSIDIANWVVDQKYKGGKFNMMYEI